MTFAKHHACFALLSFLVFSLATLPASAQNDVTGKLKIHVSPKQAYVFVDGKAIREAPRPVSRE